MKTIKQIFLYLFAADMKFLFPRFRVKWEFMLEFMRDGKESWNHE